MIRNDQVAEEGRAVDPQQAEAMPNPPEVPEGSLKADMPAGGRSDGQRPPYTFAIGQAGARFPSLDVEREFAQATGRLDTTEGLTDRQTLHRVLSEPGNRYLVRAMCWVLSIEGLPTYLLLPRDPADFDLLVEALRAEPSPGDVDVVIGVRGPLAPPEACNGLVVPIVVFDQLYSFDRDALIEAIPVPDSIPEEDQPQFRQAAGELFDRIMGMADNAGATSEHRALNYLAVRYDAIYALAAEAHRAEQSLTAVEVRPSPLSGPRELFDVIFSFTDRRTDVISKHRATVDTTGEWPNLVRKLSPYFDV